MQGRPERSTRACRGLGICILMTMEEPLHSIEWGRDISQFMF